MSKHWHNSLSDWMYLAINLCLCLAISASISSRPNQYRHSAITSIDVVQRTFMRTLFKVNSMTSAEFHLLDMPLKHTVNMAYIWILSTGELLPLSPSCQFCVKRTVGRFGVVKVTFEIPSSDICTQGSADKNKFIIAVLSRLDCATYSMYKFTNDIKYSYQLIN